MPVKGILVGNSNCLMDGNFEEIIDGFDIVIRMNGGKPTEDNSHHIGERTTYWSVSAADESVYKSWKIPKAVPWHLNRRVKYPCVGVSNPVSNYRDLVTGYGFNRPSTGLITAHYAVNVEQIDLALIGFDFYRYGSWYCEKRSDTPHDWNREEMYMQSLGVVIL